MSNELFIFGLVFVAIYLLVMTIYMKRKKKGGGERIMFAVIFGLFLLMVEVTTWVMIGELIGW